jgi:hypothetical protein
MTEQVFIRQLSHLPENVKAELWAYFEYLLFKYQIPKNTTTGKKDSPQRKTPKAGFLKGTFIMHEGFDEPVRIKLEAPNLNN